MAYNTEPMHEVLKWDYSGSSWNIPPIFVSVPEPFLPTQANPVKKQIWQSTVNWSKWAQWLRCWEPFCQSWGRLCSLRVSFKQYWIRYCQERQAKELLCNQDYDKERRERIFLGLYTSQCEGLQQSMRRSERPLSAASHLTSSVVSKYTVKNIANEKEGTSSARRELHQPLKGKTQPGECRQSWTASKRVVRICTWSSALHDVLSDTSCVDPEKGSEWTDSRCCLNYCQVYLNYRHAALRCARTADIGTNIWQRHMNNSNSRFGSLHRTKVSPGPPNRIWNPWNIKSPCWSLLQFSKMNYENVPHMPQIPFTWRSNIDINTGLSPNSPRPPVIVQLT